MGGEGRKGEARGTTGGKGGEESKGGEARGANGDGGDGAEGGKVKGGVTAGNAVSYTHLTLPTKRIV